MATEQGRFTGRTISNIYTIQGRLGEGGMGEAYQASFFHQNNPIVVKFLLHINDRNLTAFQKEAAVHSRLNHPNIVPFYRYGIHEEGSEKIPYIIMAYAEEGSMLELIRRRGILPLEQSTDILLQTSDGVQYAHEQKVLHRDLKPHNLLLQKDPLKREPRSQQFVVWVSDFGISVTAHGLQSELITSQHEEGTPAYMAPEQFEGKARIPSDLYSLGVIAFQLLTRELPFRKDTYPEYYLAHKLEPVPSFEQTIRRQGREMAYPVGEFEEIVAKALQKDPANRYQSAGDFGEAIRVTLANIRAKEEADKRDFDMRNVKEVINKEQTRQLLEKGLTLRATADPDKHIAAVVLFSLACELDPNNEQAYLNKGLELNALERYEEAIAAYDQAIKLDPYNVATYIHKGTALRALGKTEEAIATYDQLIILDPYNPNNNAAYNSKGLAFQELGRTEEAIVAFDQAIKLDPDNPNNSVVYSNKAFLLYSLGRREEAIAAYDQAIRISPNNSDLYFSKGKILQELGRHEEAVAAFEQTIQHNSEDSYGHVSKGYSLSMLGRHKEAIAVYDQAIRISPNNSAPYTNKGNALHALGRTEEAIAAFDQAIKLEPKNIDAYIKKGYGLQELGRREEAIAAFVTRQLN